MGDSPSADVPLQVAADETLLDDLGALLLYGPLAWHVRVTITDKRLQMRPTRRLERLAGAKSQLITLDDIDSVSWSRIQQQVSIKLSDRTLRIAGRGATALHKRLKELLDPDPDPNPTATKASAHSSFLPGERVWVEGTVDAVVRDPLWARGTVQLTSQRVRFEPSRGMQRLVLSGRPVEVRLADIVGIRITRGGTGIALLWCIEDETTQRIELEAAMELVRGVMPALVAAMRSMGAIVLGEAVEPPANLIPLQVPLMVSQARLGSGALARTGTIAIGIGGVWFTSDDFVATVAGTSAEGLAIQDIIRVHADAPVTRTVKLERRGGGDSLVLESTGASFRVEPLASLMATQPPVQGLVLDKHGRLTDADLRNLARMNASILPEGRGINALKGGAAVRITHRGNLVRGWLIVLSSGLLFLPIDGLAQDRVYLDGPLIDRSRSRADDNGVLNVTVERREERFAISGGRRTAAELWHTMWSHLPDARSLADRYPYLKALVGRIGYIRLKHRQVEILSRRMLTTTLERNGIGVRIGHGLPEMVGPGLDVEVEMGSEKTVYLFRTHIADVDERDGDTWVTLGLSTKVQCRDNRRRAFRVAFEQDLGVQRLAHHDATPDEQILSGKTANLSWTGLALLLPDEQPVGTLLQAKLDLTGEPLTHTLEVIYTKLLTAEKTVLHGCRLLNLSAGQQDHVQSLVIRQQMQEVASREIRNDRGGRPVSTTDRVRQIDDYDSEDTETEKIRR